MTGEDLTQCEASTIRSQLLVDAPDQSTAVAYRLAVIEFVRSPESRIEDLRVSLSGVDERVFPAALGFRLDIIAKPDWMERFRYYDDKYDRQRGRDFLAEQVPRFARDIAAHLLDRFAGLASVLMLEGDAVSTRLTRPEAP